MADPDAGRIDDIQIGGDSRVDAYQVKWAIDGGTFTFNRLITPDGEAPSLIAQLADGALRIGAFHPGCAVFVHLVTNEIPSVSDKLPAATPRPAPGHFSAFLNQAWYPIHRGEIIQVPQIWLEAWERLRQAAAVSEDQWLGFVSQCVLEFGYRPPETTYVSPSDRAQINADLENITLLLFGEAGGPGRTVELSRADLINKLGWQGRFEFRSRHDFPIPLELYEPIASTQGRLEQALDTLTKGYVGVLGSPGSGKSTLLTEVVRQRSERVVRYYAYVPDSATPLALRGESVSFLHDVVLALDRAGIRPGPGLIGLDRIQLQQRLREQLDILGAEWRKSQRKTIIMVDGLDHIEREQHPERSLLRDLPTPDEIPQGVLFVLGSQTDQLEGLPDRVQYSIRQPQRRIEMEPLTRAAVHAVVRRSKLASASFPSLPHRIFTASDGHPLALRLILEQVQEAADDSSIQRVLDTWMDHAGNVQAEYHSYWRSIASDSEMVKLLALLARLRRPIDIGWVQTWVARPVLNRLFGPVRHYFRREGERWYFFHNSFRQFLLRATAEELDGGLSAGANRAYHAELADYCSSSSISAWKWEEMHHRYEAGQDRIALEKATPEFFRNQFLQFRPLDRINADIDSGLQALHCERNVPLLARLVLAGSEMHERGRELEGSWIVRALVALGKTDAAVEHLLDGHVLLANNALALEMATALKKRGIHNEADLLYGLAEPLDLLHGKVEDAHQSSRDIRSELNAWAGAAPYFRFLEDVIRSIKSIPPMSVERGIRDTVEDLKGDLLFECGITLLTEGRTSDFQGLLKGLDPSEPDQESVRFWLKLRQCQYYFEGRQVEEARALIEEIGSETALGDHGSGAALGIASLTYRLKRDAEPARRLVRSLQIPVPDPHRFSFMRGDFQAFRALHDFRRLQRIAGEAPPPFEIASASGVADAQYIGYFTGCVAVAADISAEAWMGRIFDPATISNRVLPLMRIASFQRDRGGKSPGNSSELLGRVGADLYQLLVSAVAMHGPEATEQLRSDFEGEWGREGAALLWSSQLRRAIIVALHRAGSPLAWCRSQLISIEVFMLEGHDINGRMEECRRQCDAWLEVGDLEAAERNLRLGLEVSFGVGFRKDYQLGEWIAWVREVNRRAPAQAATRIAWLAHAVASLRDSTEGRAAYRGAEDLLEAAFDWSPRNAVTLLLWLVDQQVISFANGVAQLLTAAVRAQAQVDLRATECVLSQFVFPTSATGHPELADQLIRRTQTTMGRSAGVEVAQRLLEQISYNCLQSTRGAWWAGVKRAVYLGKLGLLVPNESGGEWTEHSSRLLKLVDGSHLTTEEVTALIESPEQLLSLMRSSAPGSYFDWAPVVRSVGGMLGRTDLEDIVAAATESNERSSLLAALSERAAVLGDMDYAWALGEKALAATTPHGWDRAMSGDRLEAYGALLKVDAERARAMAYRDLTQSLTAEFNYPQNIARNLLVILPLISDQDLVLSVWEDVEKYLRQLLGDLSGFDEGPAFRDFRNDTSTSSICSLIVGCLNHPTYPMAHAAQRCCRDLLSGGVGDLADPMKVGLRDETGLSIPLLMILESVAQENLALVEQFRDELNSLVSSRDWAIREAAARLAGLIEHQPPDLARISRRLPASYDLTVPVLRISIPGTDGDPEPGKPLPDTNDPFLLVRPFGNQLGVIARAARIPQDKVMRRVVQIMDGLRPFQEWSATGEERLRRILDSAGLRLSFVRPRTALVRRAMFTLVAELYDAGVFQLEEIRALERVLRYYDSSMLRYLPQAPPTELPPLKPEGIGNRPEFIAGLATIAKVPAIERLGDWYVLAEDTCVRSLDCSVETEKRKALVRHGNTPPGNAWADLPEVNHIYESEYADLAPDTPDILAIRNRGERFESPAQNWLAFNPEAARSLGWSISPKGLFEWRASDGATRARTIWWSFGGYQCTPPHLDDEVGEGWLVVASAAALREIISRVGQLHRDVIISRSARRDGDKETAERTDTYSIEV